MARAEWLWEKGVRDEVREGQSGSRLYRPWRALEEMPWEKGGAPGRGRRGAQLLKAPIQAFLWLLLNTPHGLDSVPGVYVGHSPLL